jgi:glycosyltransferase involved in cell wall biosynthesis
MRILLGSDTYPPDVNGASHFTERLARGLMDRGHAVEVVCPGVRRRFESRRQHGVPVSAIGSLPVPLYPALRFSPPHPGRNTRLRVVIRKFKPDLIHVHNPFFLSRALMRQGRRLGIPTVATNHVVPENLMVQVEFFPAPVRRVVEAWLTRDLGRAYASVNRLATPTPIAAAELERCGTRQNVTPISNGIDVSGYLPHVDPAEARLALGLPERPTITFVGRLDREKRLERLIAAFARLDTPNAQLVLVGHGKERDRLESVASKHGLGGNVIFTGFIPDEDLPLAYAACDVFCMPGTAELQSIATLEAMATGRPVVAAAALALPHLVVEGVNGQLYKPADLDALAACLDRLLGDAELRQRMGRRSLELVAAHSHLATLDAYEALYAQALGPAPATAKPGSAATGQAEPPTSAEARAEVH